MRSRLSFSCRVHLNVSHLILGCRNTAKGEEAKTAVLASNLLSQKPPTIEVWPLDMARYDSVRAFGQRASQTLSCLDAVILNAGVDLRQFELAEGIESTLTVNVVSTFLLAQLVLPKLRETAETQGRDTNLTFVGSMIHIFAKTEQLVNAKRGQIFKTLSDPARTNMDQRYSLSKLLLTMAHRDLTVRADKSAKGGTSPVIINDVNPGWCKTALFRHETPGFGKKISERLMVRTGEQGARTLTHAASAGRQTHGQYVSECRVKPVSHFVQSKAGHQTQEKLGAELSEILESISPGVTKAF